ncbi:discoidin domain-containing protein, partial [Clostridium gasigenes]
MLKRNKKFKVLIKFAGIVLPICMAVSLFPSSVIVVKAYEEKEILDRAYVKSALKTIGTVTKITKEGDNVNIDLSTGEKIKISFLENKVFRLHMEPTGELAEYPTPNKPDETTKIIDKTDEAYEKEYGTIDIKIDESNANFYKISTESLELSIEKSTSKMSLYDIANAKVLWSEAEPLKYSDDKTIQTLDTKDKENFYGGGQQNGYFSHKNSSINISVGGGWDAGAASSPVPFYVSSEGYGVMRNTFQPGKYDFSKTATFTHEEGRFDAYYFVDDSITKVIDSYTELTGKAALMPEYSFYLGHADAFNGVHNGHNDKRELLGKGLETVNKYVDNDMPLGWFLPNDGYGCGYGGLDNLNKFVDEVNKKNIEVGLWTQSELYPDLSLPLDSPLRRDLNGEIQSGVRAIKTDVAWVGSGYSMALNATRQAAEGIEKEENSGGARPFIVSLDGWAGTQRYAGLWSGDQYGGNWEYIRMHIPTYIGAGLSGNPNIGSDMDGIFGGDKIIQTRDFQWKAFTPIQIDMDGWAAGGNDYSKEKNPWNYGEPYASMNRMYLKLKAQMMPYIYTNAEESTSTSNPMIRAMMLEYPNDPYTYGTETQYQYMWGPNMLVAPVYNESDNDAGVRNGIYLPDEDQVWIDYFTGEQYKGGSVINNFDAPIWKTPVFIKDGAIIPMAPENNAIKELDGSENRIFDVYPSGSTEFTMYEDDGKTTDYKEDKNTRTKITSEVTGEKAVITVNKSEGNGYDGMVNNRGTEVIVNTRQEASNVTVKVGDKDVTVKAVTTQEEYDNGENVYFYNEKPNLNKYSTEGSEFEKTEVISTPKLYVKVEKTDIMSNVVTVTVDGFNNTQVKNVTDAEVPASPTGLKADDAKITDRVIGLNWDKVNGTNVTYDLMIDGTIYTNVFKGANEEELPSYIHSGLIQDTEHKYQVRATNSKGASEWSNELIGKTKLDRYRNIPKNMTATADSEQDGSGIDQAIDGDDNTLWHSNWNDGNVLPHTVDIDMKLAYQLDKFEYLPRPDVSNGTILKYNLDVSLDGKIYKNIVTDGIFEKTADVKTIKFDAGVTARYIRLTATNALGGFGSAQEFRPYKKDKTEGVVVGENIPNGAIDEADLLFFASYMGVDTNDTAWEQVSLVDINYNGVIDAYDLMYVASQLGEGEFSPSGIPISGGVSIKSSKEDLKAGDEFTVDIFGSELKDINAFSLELLLDSNKYELITDSTKIVTGADVVKDMLNYSILGGVGTSKQRIMAAFSNKGSQATLNGDQKLATIKLKAKQDIKFDMTIERLILVNTAFDTIKNGDDTKVDKSVLNAKIGQIEKINKEDFTENTVASLVEKLNAAKALVGDEKATQESVDKALKELQDAMDKLEKIIKEEIVLTKDDMTVTGEADKMQDGAGAFDKLVDGIISEDSLAELKWSITEADGISLPLKVDFNFNKPQQINSFTAYNRPENTNGKIKKLSAKGYDEAGKEYDLGTKDVGKTAKDVSFETNAIKYDRIEVTFLESHSGPLMLSIAEVQFITKNDSAAIVNKATLSGKIGETEKINKEDFTENTVATLVGKLDAAKAIVIDEKATQESVDTALKELQSAIDQLE